MSVDHPTNQQKSLSLPRDGSLVGLPTNGGECLPCGIAFVNPNATAAGVVGEDHHGRVSRTSSNAESTLTKRSNRSLCHTIIPEESHYVETGSGYYSYPEMHPLKGKVYSDSMLCPVSNMDQIDMCHLSRAIDMRKASEPIPQVPWGVNTPDIFRSMKRYSIQINSSLNQSINSVAQRFVHPSLLGKRSSKECWQKSFDDWVKKNIEVRECVKFVKKADAVDNDPICYCRNKRSDHLRGRTIEMPDASTWVQRDNTERTENTAFGKIMFENVEQSIDEAQYMRIAVDYGNSPYKEKLNTLIKDFWKLDPPGLLISVSGGAKSFNVSQDICASFQQGLLNAAKSTDAWIITGGQYCGVMKLVGDVIARTVSKRRIPTIGIGNWGKTWKNHKLLIENRRSDAPDITYYPVEEPAKGFATLDPNHTHHFLVDDGTTGNDGIEYSFRAALEMLICEMHKIENVRLPMVCIMVEGGMRSLEIAKGTLENGNTLVVLKGSGRASDILCYCFENSIEIEKDGGKKERILPSESEKEIKRLIQKDFGKYNIEKEMVELVLKISNYRDFVTIFSIHNPEPLDFYILSSLMSSANANVMAAAKMRQMRLAITWGHAKIAREFIFSQKLYKFSADELNQLMFFSITKQRTDFVKLLIDYGCDLKQFLNAETLERLYNSLNKKSGGYRLLMEKANRKRQKSRYDTLRNVEDGIDTDKSKVPHRIELSDVGSLLGRIMQGSYTSFFNKKKHEKTATFDVIFQNPFDLMAIYCCLDNCQDMALLFWEKSRTPMATGIIAHRIYNFLDMMEAKWARMDEEMTEQLENAASQFEMLSCNLMTMCYHNYEKKEWVNILEVKMVDWGNLSLFEVAQITNAKNFLSHAAYQSYLTDIWMGDIHQSTPFFLLVLATIIPPIPVFLNYTTNSNSNKSNEILRDASVADKDDIKRKQPNILKRFKLFYTSPAVKFILNCIFYLFFLGLYICRLLAPNVCMEMGDDSGTNGDTPEYMIDWIDYYLIIFVGSTIPIEISQVIDGNTKSVLKKFKIYFKQLYNVIDLLAIIIFMIAFTMKITIRCENTERYKLWKFTEYHLYRMLASMCFILYSIRFIQMFEINAKIGPKIFMLKRMAVDLFFFLFLLGVFTFSYCVASEALLYPFHQRAVNKTVFAAFRRSYFNVFGDLNIDGMSEKLVEGHCNKETWLYTNHRQDGNLNVTEMRRKHSFDKETDCNTKNATAVDWVENTIVGLTNYYICFILLCTYVLTVNIMLINLLIAIFSNTYSDSKAKSGIIYKTQRASVIVEFEERPWLPNPLSLIYFVFMVPYKLLRRCCKGKNTSGSIRDRRNKNDNKEARRAQLIEAECMVLLLRKRQLESQNGLQIIELQNKKIKAEVEKIAAELKSITLKQHKETLSVVTGKRSGGLFGNTVTQAMHALTAPATRHKLSLTREAYARYGILRVEFPHDCVDWETSLDFYDPPEFTDESVDTDESVFPDEIKFNSETNDINRISYYRSYQVDSGDPLNVRGRTGLKGRGIYRRWGPNHFAVTVITRWYRPGTGNNVYVRNKPVLEVLLIQYENETPDKEQNTRYYHLPEVQIDKEDPTKFYNKSTVKWMCYNIKSSQPAPSNNDFQEVVRKFKAAKAPPKTAPASNNEHLFDDAFKSWNFVYRGYCDDIYNTDNAWKEVEAITVNFENPLANRPLEKGPKVFEVSWQKLDSKVRMRNNEAWLLKKVCQINRAYNPYAGESLL